MSPGVMGVLVGVGAPSSRQRRRDRSSGSLRSE